MAKKIKFKKLTKAKKQSIVGDGEEEGINEIGTPVPGKLPPSNE